LNSMKPKPRGRLHTNIAESGLQEHRQVVCQGSSSGAAASEG
jgi:hypothetical protein